MKQNKQSTLEPPDTSSVDRSLASLHAMGFISTPDDDGELTHTGKFASGLGVDLQLGRMVRCVFWMECVWYDRRMLNCRLID